MILIQFQVNHEKYETLSANTPIHIFINRINNRLVVKIKVGYKLEITMSLIPLTITFTDQNGRLLEIEDGFVSFSRCLSGKYWQKIK